MRAVHVQSPGDQDSLRQIGRRSPFQAPVASSGIGIHRTSPGRNSIWDLRGELQRQRILSCAEALSHPKASLHLALDAVGMLNQKFSAVSKSRVPELQKYRGGSCKGFLTFVYRP